MPLEFRVRWEREGRQPHHVIYQDWNAACRKVRSVQAMDQIKGDTERFEDMPDLVSVELQVREVGEWHAHDYQPEVTGGDVKQLREHLWIRHGEPRWAPDDLPSEPFPF